MLETTTKDDFPVVGEPSSSGSGSGGEGGDKSREISTALETVFRVFSREFVILYSIFFRENASFSASHSEISISR